MKFDCSNFIEVTLRFGSNHIDRKAIINVLDIEEIIQDGVFGNEPVLLMRNRASVCLYKKDLKKIIKFLKAHGGDVSVEFTKEREN